MLGATSARSNASATIARLTIVIASFGWLPVDLTSAARKMAASVRAPGDIVPDSASRLIDDAGLTSGQETV
jgi:hypothetical protein